MCYHIIRKKEGLMKNSIFVLQTLNWTPLDKCRAKLKLDMYICIKAKTISSKPKAQYIIK